MRFTITTKRPKGRPKIEKTDSLAIAWLLFANAVRALPEAEVTLHDKHYDIEVSG